MKAIRSFLAFDIGASSGRGLLGTLQGGRLKLREQVRFPNAMLAIGRHWHWNVYQLYEEVLRGLESCAEGESAIPESMGIDTWGVDFGLLAEDGSLLGLPFAYRDPHTRGCMEAFFERIPRERIYARTGIQFLPFNTLFQLYALRRAASPLPDLAAALLFMPDLLNHLLTGEMRTESTVASTSQLMAPGGGVWVRELLDALEISASLFPPPVEPGSEIGRLSGAASAAAGGNIPVVAVASHDTASAVAAVPAEGEEWAYISSGTWSLMGVEVREPVMTESAMTLNFTNEGGLGGTIRLLKNISGLWLLQECRRLWSDHHSGDISDLLRAAESAPAFRSLVDPDHPDFLNPPDMPAAIAGWCLRTGQAAPESAPEFVRCILESLALKYRVTLDELKTLAPRPIRRLHIIGGGARNSLLNQWTADATGLPVTAGPAEATAIGNLLVQALAKGALDSHVEIRRLVRRSFELRDHIPARTSEWESALARFRGLLDRPPPLKEET